MFVLKKNTYVDNGKCWYQDEYGNEAYMKQIEKGFIAKLRFNDKDIKVEALTINIPLDETTDGAQLRMNVEASVIDNTPELRHGVNGFTQLIQRWINMSYDIQNFSISQMVKDSSSDKEIKDMYKERMENLRGFEELSMIFGKSGFDVLESLKTS